ncbi:efflux RND transporter periplasmic adaptor subunit [Massilia sp. S19_KUP03_FR1]|uniref:efflux RND transporter periplasmic adaptor subunit n=1 Tax=Massilia sp. S19_KUP03_FR1 TaxID=3025503 RepID=UPI002FCDDD4D
MNIQQTPKQKIAIGAIVAAGLILALLIVFLKPASESTEAAPAAAHAEEAGHDGTVKLTEAQIKTSAIAILTAAPATIHSAITLPGEIRFNADRTAQVVPLLGGTVQAVQADIGQQVRRGQVLALIASVDLSDQRSAALMAQRRLALARTTYAREKQLWEEKISAEQDYLQARQAMQEAEIGVNNAQQKLAALGAGGASAGSLNSYAVRAPFDGVIVEKHIALGQSVKNDNVLFMVSDLSTVWADVAVPAGDLAQVRVGENVTVRAGAKKAGVAGKVAYVGALLGNQTRTAVARIVLANGQGAWRPGMFVDVDLEVSSGERAVPVAVAASAIQTIEDKPAVFVRVAGGFAARAVTLGRADKNQVEVRTGLAAGDAYAAANSFVIKAELGKASEGGH